MGQWDNVDHVDHFHTMNGTAYMYNGKSASTIHNRNSDKLMHTSTRQTLHVLRRERPSNKSSPLLQPTPHLRARNLIARQRGIDVDQDTRVSSLVQSSTLATISARFARVRSS